jgi:hypothetical protein
MGTYFLGDKLYITSSDYALMVEYLEEGVEISINGDGRFGSERVSGSDLIRFAGACFAAGYGIDGFEKEVIGRLYVEDDRIRVMVQGSMNDRVFVKVRPEHFLEMAHICIAKYYPLSGSLSVADYSLTYNLSPSGVLLFLNGKEGQGEIFVEREKASLLVGLIEASFIGRSLGGARLISEKEEKSLYVEEIVEAKEPPERLIVDYVVYGNEKRAVEKPLHEWILSLKEFAKDNGKSPSGVLRAFLRKHGISYDRKILLILREKEKKKEITLRLPVHFAKGFAMVLERWIYAGC